MGNVNVIEIAGKIYQFLIDYNNFCYYLKINKQQLFGGKIEVIEFLK